MSNLIFQLFFIGVLCASFNTLCGQNLSALKTPEGIEISEGGSKVLFYQSEAKDLGGRYSRANYVHPLYSMQGSILTEDFPEDHPHHRGIFWAWHQIIVDGKRVADSWSCENISWDVIRTDVRRKKSQIAVGSEVLWKSVLTEGSEPETIIREKSRITVHAATRHYRFVDFEIDLAAEVDHMKIGGSDDSKGYGGFSLRFKLPGDIRFMSEGNKLTAQELAIDAGPWLDISGAFEDNHPRSGITVLCHPENPGHPEPWILRSAKSMQNAAFPGRTPVVLTKAGLKFRYRLIVHDGTPDAKVIEKLYRDYLE